MKKLQERRDELKKRIQPLAAKADGLTQQEADDLEKMLGEIKSLDLQIKAQELGADNGDEDAPADGDGLAAQVDGLTKNVNRIMEALEKMPSSQNPGFFTDVGGDADPNVKSFADFCLAIYRNDEKRLKTVYKSTKDLGSDSGPAGGYLVPRDFDTRLMQIAAGVSQVVSRCQSIPVGSDSGDYPALDEYITPTAGSGQTAAAAGVKATTKAQGATLDETEPGFVMLQFRVKKIGGYTEVNNELIQDSPQAIGSLLEQLFGIAVAARMERDVFRGNGSTDFLGILNAPAAVGVSPDNDNVFAYPDMIEMRSRFKRVSGEPVFALHQSIWPDIGAFEIGTGGAGVPSGGGTPDQFERMPGTNIAILESEHLPQADNAGCVLLADFGAYLIFRRGTLSIAFSEHAGFTADKGTWRFTQRADGMPWVKNSITLADPQGSYTVSPFVYFND